MHHFNIQYSSVLSTAPATKNMLLSSRDDKSTCNPPDDYFNQTASCLTNQRDYTPAKNRQKPSPLSFFILSPFRPC
jgi:hypothetical protein